MFLINLCIFRRGLPGGRGPNGKVGPRGPQGRDGPQGKKFHHLFSNLNNLNGQIGKHVLGIV